MRLASLQLNLAKTVLSGSVLLSFVVGFLCIGFILAMPAHASMDMGAMPNHAQQTGAFNNCCDTGASDHMELWKSTFEGIPVSLQQFLALVAISIFAAFTFRDFFSVPRLNINFLFTRFKQYAREHPDIQTYNALRLAFASGIFHPKTF